MYAKTAYFRAMLNSPAALLNTFGRPLSRGGMCFTVVLMDAWLTAFRSGRTEHRSALKNVLSQHPQTSDWVRDADEIRETIRHRRRSHEWILDIIARSDNDAGARELLVHEGGDCDITTQLLYAAVRECATKCLDVAWNQPNINKNVSRHLFIPSDCAWLSLDAISQIYLDPNTQWARHGQHLDELASWAVRRPDVIDMFKNCKR